MTITSNSMRAVVVLISTVLLTTCRQSDVTGPGRNSIEIEIVATDQLPAAVDSTRVYLLPFVPLSSGQTRLDTLMADSVGRQFTSLDFPIVEAWYPNSESVCLDPSFHPHKLFVRFSDPDDRILSKGFTRATVPMDLCFLTWRHYKYSSTR